VFFNKYKAAFFSYAHPIIFFSSPILCIHFFLCIPYCFCRGQTLDWYIVTYLFFHIATLKYPGTWDTLVIPTPKYLNIITYRVAFHSQRLLFLRSLLFLSVVPFIHFLSCASLLSDYSSILLLPSLLNVVPIPSPFLPLRSRFAYFCFIIFTNNKLVIIRTPTQNK